MKRLILAMLIATPALAHDWYPPGCCGGQDCRPVTCTDVEIAPDGSATYKPEGAHFEKGHVQISQDGQCHVCTRTKRNIYNGQTETFGYCAFIAGTS